MSLLDLEDTLKNKIHEVYKNHLLEGTPFMFTQLSIEEQNELIWSAAQEHLDRDILNQWEYLENFDMSRFVLAVLKGTSFDTSYYVSDLADTIRVYFQEIVEQEMEAYENNY